MQSHSGIIFITIRQFVLDDINVMYYYYYYLLRKLPKKCDADLKSTANWATVMPFVQNKNLINNNKYLSSDSESLFPRTLQDTDCMHHLERPGL